MGRSVRIDAEVAAADAACPDCGRRSARLHSRYQRLLSDPAIGGRQTLLRVRVRRFFCDDHGCPRRTFAEQVPSLTLLRLVRALPLPEAGTVPVVGVDDFAFRKGNTYGSIIVDMLTGRPVDLLPDRRADSFAAWLRAHPGAEVICRDRASGYAEGARLGAPDAIQVADRFHLLHNLTQAVDRVVRAHRGCLKDRPEADAVAQPRPATDSKEGRRAEVTRQRHGEIHALAGTGVGTTAISRALNVDDKTVRRYLRAAIADDLLTETVTNCSPRIRGDSAGKPREWVTGEEIHDEFSGMTTALAGRLRPPFPGCVIQPI